MKIKLNEGDILENILDVQGNEDNYKSLKVITFIDARKSKALLRIYHNGHILMATFSATEAERKYNSIIVPKKQEVTHA